MKLLSLFLLIASVSAASYKYSPDAYFLLCNAQAITNTAFSKECKSTSTSGKNRGALNATCLCGKEDYIRTMQLCFQTFTQSSPDKKGVEHSWYKLNKYCSMNNATPIYNMKEAAQALLANPINQTFEQANKTSSGAFIMPAKLYSKNNILVGADYWWQLTRSDLFGKASVIFIFGIFAIQVCLNVIAWMMPSVSRLLLNNPASRLYRQHFGMPALFNGRSSQPVSYLKGTFEITMPQRVHSFLIAMFFMISMIFLCYNYPVYLSSATQSTRVKYITFFVGYRSGILGMYLMPALWLFGTRNNFLIWLTGWQFEIFNHWHRWVSRMFTGHIMIHTIFWSYNLWLGSRMSKFKANYLVWGFVAIGCMFLMCIHSFKQFRRLSYEFFLYLHIILGVFTVIGTYYHLIKTNQCFAQLWVAVGVWALDRVIRIARVFMANPFRSRATLIAHDNDLLEVKVKYSGAWKPQAGSYAYIYFLDFLRFYQSHPFTLMPVEESKDEFRMVIKIKKGLTKALYNKVIKNGGSLDYPVLVEGPYGVQVNFAPFKEVIMAAGGVGFSAVYSHIAGSSITTRPDTEYTIHWTVREKTILQCYAPEIEHLKEMHNVHINVYFAHGAEAVDAATEGTESDVVKSVTSGGSSTEKSQGNNMEINHFKPNYRDLITSHCLESRGPICAFACGPHSMNDDVRYGCANSISRTRNLVQFYEESFTM